MSSFSGDYYRRLRLPQNASRQQIKAAFRRLSRQYHPDLHPNQPTAASAFQALREAYEVLIDPVQRQHYDRIVPPGKSMTDAAIAQASRRLKDPRAATDFYLRGVRYTLAQRHHDALEEYNRAIALGPKLEAAYLRRAETRYYLGDDPGVLADCQRAIALNPTEAQTHYYLGLARFRLGYVQSAIAAFTSAIAHDNEDAQTFARRGLAYEDLGDANEAAQDLRRAAQLYRAQGDIAKYNRLRQYLRRFGTAGRSLPVRLVGRLSKRLLDLWTGLWLGLKSGLGIERHADAGWLPNDPTDQDAVIRQQSIDRLSSRPPNQLEDGLSEGRSPDSESVRSDNPLNNSPRDRSRRRRPWPLANNPWHSRSSKELRGGRSRQVYWAPGVSSRPLEGDPQPSSSRGVVWLLGGFLTVLRLLSNPAGELVPVYRQLSHSQVNRVGYGLAVLANLCLMTGLMSLLSQTSWLQASQLWAAGGIAYVSMVLAVAIARLCLRAKGLWAADIFTIGTAFVPIGLCAGMVVGINAGVSAIAQNSVFISGSINFWLTHLLILAVVFWAVSHSLIALYSGLCQLHPFPPKVAAWFVPMVLAIGLIAGLGTWAWLAIPTGGLVLR